MLERWPRTIAHADMDAFYAAIEQLDDKRLRGRPILVGSTSGRGVVLTASYEARPAGVGSAMPMVEARRRCPDAIVVPPRIERYQEVSAAVMAVFADFAPDVEPISLDEAFLDMSGAEHIFGPPTALGRRLKDAVFEATGGLTVTVGIAGSKYVAKVASGYEKPDGLTVVPQEDAAGWLAPQSVSVLWGAGPKMQARLAALGLNTVGDVAAYDLRKLENRLGKVGRHFFALAHGNDPRQVEGSRKARSLSSERTLSVDTDDPVEIGSHLRKAADQVARRLRSHGYIAQGIRVKLKRSDFQILTRQRALAEATNSSDQVFQCALSLLPEFKDQGPFRLIGVAAFDLHSASDNSQLDLLASPTSIRSERLDSVLDQVERRYGPGTVQRASDLKNRTVLDAGMNLDFLDAEEGGNG